LSVAKGFEGVVIDTSDICLIDGMAGRLSYRGYDIHDLTSCLSFEEVAYLLWNGDLRTRLQLSDLNERLSNERSISSAARATIKGLPSSANALDVLRTVVSMMGARSVGWSANVLEQVANNRLIRPEIEYTGPRDRKVPPPELRSIVYPLASESI